MDPEKLQNKAHVQIKQYLQSGISENTNLNQDIKQRELESINLSATNGTFVGKYQNCHLVLKGSSWFFLVLILVFFSSFF